MSVLCIIILVAVATYWLATQACNVKVNALTMEVAKASIKDRV